MFGYITPVQGELTVNDLNILKSYYCGLCFCLKNKFGNIPRIFLNYDTTFFATLLDGLSKASPDIKTSSCIRHTFSKRSYIINNPAINYAADLNVSLVYYKLLDNVMDDNDLRSRSSAKVLKHYYNKINNNHLKNTIHNSLEKLHTLENSKSTYSLDELCHPFSNIVGLILKEYPGPLEEDSDKLRNTLYTFGYSFGKWIYLIDALDDLEDDLINNAFNPLDKVYNNNLPYSELIKIIKDKLDFMLMNLITNCSDLIDKLSFKKK